MNTHKNARLAFARRMQLVRAILDQDLKAAVVAAQQDVSVPTVRKWLGRFLAEGEAGLMDRSSRPRRSPRSTRPSAALLIVELRRRLLTQARIARSVGVSAVATVSRVLKRAGISKLSDLMPSELVVRYEHARPGDLLHIDTKKLRRIERLGHRITGDPRDNTNGAGWEFFFVAIDDHARLGFTQMKAREGKSEASAFLRAAVTYFASLGVKVCRVLTDNGSAFRSKHFAKACRRLGIHHSFTRCYRPQTNGKAERFIQSALREWPHQGIGGQAPISRLPRSRNNLLQLHT